jgi:hypothetical protein
MKPLFIPTFVPLIDIISVFFDEIIKGDIILFLNYSINH